jgi:hypothetical protein
VADGRSGSSARLPGPDWEDIRRIERMFSISRAISISEGCIFGRSGGMDESGKQWGAVAERRHTSVSWGGISTQI